MRVIVDYDACEANGVCVGILPQVFELDDDDNLFVAENPDPSLANELRRAVRSCPKAALSLEGDEAAQS